MLDIVDDLTTPGCPNCAVKHLSAALAHSLEMRRMGQSSDTDNYAIVAARAFINLVEFLEGYAKHLPFAVGLLVMAEEEAEAAGAGDFADRMRIIRLHLIEKGPQFEHRFADKLYCELCHADLAWAHIAEAFREMPNDTVAVGTELDPERILSEINRLRETYFEFDEEKGGE